MKNLVIRFSAKFALACCLILCCADANPELSQPSQMLKDSGALTSVYIPLDSWIYSSMNRLYALGYVDRAYLGLRPWTQASIYAELAKIEFKLARTHNDEAQAIYGSLQQKMVSDLQSSQKKIHIESAYTSIRGISGTPLRDSYHLGSSIIDDYGRPYADGMNNYTGISGYATAGRFVAYARVELQAFPALNGYSSQLTQKIAQIDGTVNPVTGVAYSNQATIPSGSSDASVKGRLLEAYIATEIHHHVISFGKHDEWLGPAVGGSMAYSNNAENIYALQIDRRTPLYVPGLSRLTGPFEYRFLVGELRGHTLMLNPNYTAGSTTQPNVITPGNPFVHVEKVSFKPTKNLEMGFERTAIFGGKGHSPATVHTFLKSFFSMVSPEDGSKLGREDPGARFGAFDFSYRLPFVRDWLSLYADTEAHDDVSPIDAPRRAAYRTGLYLARVPKFEKLDLRVEAVNTDPPTSRSNNGAFMYVEWLEKQGYTNQGQIFGDWIGREAKGGQAWATYHLSGNEWIQGSVRTQKAAKDFIPGGTTLTDVSAQVVKRIHKDWELKGDFTFEQWKAPIYRQNQQTVTVTTMQVTWYPHK